MNLQTRILDYLLIVLATVLGIGSIVLLVVVGQTGCFNYGWSEPSIWAWDTFLSVLFFIQHSGMVRQSFRRRLGTVAPTRYHNAIYTIASGIALSAVAVFWQQSPILLIAFEGSLLWIARFLSLTAIALFALSAYSLRSFDPLGLGPITAHLKEQPHQAGPIVVRGPYRWVRHPLYSCILLLFWTNPEVTTDRLLFNVLWTAWIYLGAVLEERDLVREFGNSYLNYQRDVPMLIPWKRPAAATP